MHCSLHSSNHIESHNVIDVKINMALCNLIERWQYHDLIDAVWKLAVKINVNGLLLQLKHSYKIFRQGFD